MWWLSLIAAGSLALAACDEDPARSVKILARPALSADQAKIAPGRRAATRWRPELCPPPPEASQGRGAFVATGACAFEQTGQVNCIALGDDFFVDLSRPSAMGATLRMFINVERYKGPGRYEGSQMLVSVRTDDEVFPWNGGELTMTVSEGEQLVSVEPATLYPGFMRGAGPIEVTGKLWCKAVSDPRRR
jgi:hypothetical protein